MKRCHYNVICSAKSWSIIAAVIIGGKDKARQNPQRMNMFSLKDTMEILDDTWIMCPSCKFNNVSKATYCIQCNCNLLPDRSFVVRLVMCIVGIAGVVILIGMLRLGISSIYEL